MDREQVTLSYTAIHCRMLRDYPKTGKCEHCGFDGPTDYASINHTYTLDRKDWLEHIEMDKSIKTASTHCPRGHEWTPENTYVYPGDGRRRCRACNTLRSRLQRAQA